LTLWLSNLLLRGDGDEALASAVDRLTQALCRRVCPTFVVTNELGMGIVPFDSDVRRYRDLVGRANQVVAAAADRVVLLVAGQALVIKQAGEPGSGPG
jgi:adenosylcobinamide kinase/adenosylcobinamide-phosphate guanylyltransferase